MLPATVTDDEPAEGPRGPVGIVPDETPDWAAVEAETYARLGATLSEAHGDYRLNQTSHARAAGVVQSQLSYALRGEKLSLRSLSRMAAVVGLRLDLVPIPPADDIEADTVNGLVEQTLVDACSALPAAILAAGEERWGDVPAAIGQLVDELERAARLAQRLAAAEDDQ